MRRLIVLLLALACLPAVAQVDSITVVLSGATVHFGNGESWPEATVTMRNGKIQRIQRGAFTGLFDAAVRVIDLSGKHLYPGLIAPNSIIGLNEIDAVRATRDYRDVPGFNPHVRAAIAYNTDSRITPTIRSNGILTAEVAPKGGQISGTAAIMSMQAWNWEDAAIKENAGVHMSWPHMFQRTGWWAAPGGIKKNKGYSGSVMEIQRWFQDAQAYLKSNPPVKNLRFEAMRDIFSGERRLFVHANYVREILHVLDFAQEFKLNIAIVGGRDAAKVANLLKERNVPVVLSTLHRLPFSNDEDLDAPYREAARLDSAGVLYCLSMPNSWEQRNLPFVAGTSVAYGVPAEKALSSVTLSTAKILGIGDQLGSIEVGKDATMIVSSGDIFDMRTSVIEMAWIKGMAVDLDDKQKALYRRFGEKVEAERSGE